MKTQHTDKQRIRKLEKQVDRLSVLFFNLAVELKAQGERCDERHKFKPERKFTPPIRYKKGYSE